MNRNVYPESAESLWRLTVGPLLWGAHFLLCYWAAAVYCAKLSATLSATDITPLRLAIAVLTVLALAGIVVAGVFGYRRYRSGVGGAAPHDAASDVDRHRFIGFATLLLCGLSSVATLYTALVAVFFTDCR